MAACTLQQQHLQHIASHLPTYLPSLRSPEVAGPSAAGGAAKENSRGTTNAAAAAEGGAAPRKRAPAPRRWLSPLVLEAANSCMCWMSVLALDVYFCRQGQHQMCALSHTQAACARPNMPRFAPTHAGVQVRHWRGASQCLLFLHAQLLLFATNISQYHGLQVHHRRGAG